MLDQNGVYGVRAHRNGIDMLYFFFVGTEGKMWITVKEVTAVCHLMKLNACVNVYRLQAELNFFGSKTSAT